MSFMRPMLCGAAAFALLAAFLLQTPSVADDLAKTRFGAVEAPSKGPPRVIGYYSRGCIEGAEALPADGPAWQAMRLSRNRVYGHPSLIDFVETLSRQAPGLGFNGLLIGDLSQPRGGPMLYGHTSHQVGLDVDIWLRQMPKRRLTLEERDTLPFQSVLTADETAVDPDRLSAPLMMVMKAAALDDRVERI
ncbi:MAG: penicillin-insensitive murein endopeptidase, partial [Pseudomonadota bacterium]